MICSFCNEEHPVNDHEWPAEWDEDRRSSFIHHMRDLGVFDEHLPGMASEISRLALVSPYDVNEYDLYSYIGMTNKFHQIIISLEEKQTKRASAAKHALAGLCPTDKDSTFIGLLKLFLFVAVTLSYYLITLPRTLFLRFNLWLTRRQIQPLFTDWLRRYGLPKRV